MSKRVKAKRIELDLAKLEGRLFNLEKFQDAIRAAGHDIEGLAAEYEDKAPSKLFVITKDEKLKAPEIWKALKDVEIKENEDDGAAFIKPRQKDTYKILEMRVAALELAMDGILNAKQERKK